MFAFRLAGHLGMTVRDVLERHSSRDLAEWQAFDRLHPIDGVRRLETALGTVAAVAAAAGGAKSPRSSDYVSDYGRAYRERAEAEQAAEVAAVDPAAIAAKADAVFASMMGA